MTFPRVRLRRNRNNPFISDLLEENTININDFIQPIFIIEGNNIKQEIPTMPGIFRFSIDLAINEIKELSDMGIHNIALFPVIIQNKKTIDGIEALNENSLIIRALNEIKSKVNVNIICDIALDPYTSHGQDGVLTNEYVDNDKTINILAKQSVLYAKNGCDILAPSDMMDGRIGFIRDALEKNNFHNVMIMSYAVKYASSFYGPFRDAIDSKNNLIMDKKTYQMNPANSKEAYLEAKLDIQEGADMLIVKPGMPYLDIISNISKLNKPVIAYQVSGEYSMIKIGAQNNLFDYKNTMIESLTSFKRAGATAIITYAAKEISKEL